MQKGGDEDCIERRRLGVSLERREICCICMRNSTFYIHNNNHCFTGTHSAEHWFSLAAEDRVMIVCVSARGPRTLLNKVENTFLLRF